MTPRRTIEVIALLTGVSTAAAAAEVHTVSGAVGLEERELMMQAYSDYNLHLAFAQSTGAYLADVALSIRGPDGRLVWSGISEGPFFFAQLPRGQYQVTAEFDGSSLTKRINVAMVPGPMHHFHWKVLLN